MYPYNTRVASTEGLVENDSKVNKKDDNFIKTDKRLEKIIELAKTDVINLQEKYKKLIDVGMFKEDKNLLQTMYLDELKHEKQLNEVLYHLENNGNNGTDSNNTDNDLDTDLGVKRFIEELILLEMDNVNFYNNLSQSVPNGADTEIIIDILTGISSNKQTHSTGLSYLYSKYF